MFNLENSIKNWLRSFQKYRAFDHGSLREMELHLRDHIDDLVSEGLNEKEAFEQAVESFGEISPMADEEFYNIKRKTTIRSLIYTTMFNNYFKTSLRSMLRNPMSSFINVFGLAVAVGICLVVYAFYKFDNSIDQFHEHRNEVFLTTFFVDRDGTTEQYGTSPAPLGEMLKEDFAQIDNVCRIEDRNVVIKYEDNVFHEVTRFVDPEFLKMLTFPLKWGSASSLADMNSIIISEEMSVKYFGDENPVGRDILMKFNDDSGKSFRVSGVANTFPDARTISFDFLINFENLKISDPTFNTGDWKEFVDATLIQVKDPSAWDAIEAGMNKYKNIQNEVQSDWAISSFTFENLATLHKRSGSIRADISFDGSAEARLGLPVIAFFMLALACFNYMNIAIVSAAKRLKEIGIRKVIGANRGRIIIQFLSENVFVTLFALLIGMMLAITVFLPWFIDITGDNMDLNLIDANLWIFLVALLLGTGLISGMYPAFYISKFQVVNIFKGTVRFGKKNTLNKVFMGMQLILACILIMGAVITTQNTVYQHSQSWGYDQHSALYAQVQDQTAYERLSAAMIQDPNISSVTGSKHHLGMDRVSTIVHMPDRQYEVLEFAVDANYFNTLDLKLKEGRFFEENHESDLSKVVVNELLVDKFKLKKPIGEVFKIDSVRYEIIGVVHDFHANNFYYEVLPTIFTNSQPSDYKYLTVKAIDGNEKEAYAALKSNWLTLFPETPFQGGFQEDVWVGFFEQLNTMERFYKAIALIAIILASLGLYGLVTLNVSGRIREFSIRKSLGAGAINIASNITRQYVLLAAVAFLIGAPVSYYLNKALLDMMFAYLKPIGFLDAALSILIIVLVLVTVVLTQVIKVSRSNPVDGLRVE